MKSFLKYTFATFSVVFILSAVSIFCVGQANFSVGKNYMQFLRAQKFMQLNGTARNRKIYNTYLSEDVDEFDEYETEVDPFLNEAYISSMEKKKIDDDFFTIDKERTDKNNLKEIDIEKEGKNLLGGGTCIVNEKGVLDVSINSEDIFNLKKYTIQLTSSSIVIKEENENFEKDNIVEEIPYESIKLPIETIEETTECWKIKTNKKKNFLFCETTKQNRDKWITNILKALFCYNVNVLTIDQNSSTILKKEIVIPKESTVEQRMKNKTI